MESSAIRNRKTRFHRENGPPARLKKISLENQNKKKLRGIIPNIHMFTNWSSTQTFPCIKRIVIILQRLTTLVLFIDLFHIIFDFWRITLKEHGLHAVGYGLVTYLSPLPIYTYSWQAQVWGTGKIITIIKRKKLTRYLPVAFWAIMKLKRKEYVRWYGDQ